MAGRDRILPSPVFEQTATLLDYLPASSLLLTVGEIQQASEQFWLDVQQRYEDRRYDLSRPLLAPSSLYLPVDQLFSILKEHTQIRCQPLPAEEKPDVSICRLMHCLSSPLKRNSKSRWMHYSDS